MTSAHPPGYPLRVISAQASAASGARAGERRGFRRIPHPLGPAHLGGGGPGAVRLLPAGLHLAAGGARARAAGAGADRRRLRGSFGCALAFGLAQFVPLLSWLINLAWYAWAALAGFEAVIFALLAIGQRLLLRLPCCPVAWRAVGPGEGMRDRWPYAFPWAGWR